MQTRGQRHHLWAVRQVKLKRVRKFSYIAIFPTALVFYEYVITLQEEVETIWRRRWNAATVLFMVNRYLMVVYNAVGIVIPTTAEVRLDNLRAELFKLTDIA